MSPGERVEGFEQGSWPDGGFGHREHVQIAWSYLQVAPLVEVLRRLPAGLRRLATAAGKPEKYHETLTWAWVLLIHERIRRSPEGAAWERFAADNRDLFRREPSILASYYHPATLASEQARSSFVLPDRIASP